VTDPHQFAEIMSITSEKSVFTGQDNILIFTDETFASAHL